MATDSRSVPNSAGENEKHPCETAGFENQRMSDRRFAKSTTVQPHARKINECDTTVLHNQRMLYRGFDKPTNVRPKVGNICAL